MAFQTTQDDTVDGVRFFEMQANGWTVRSAINLESKSVLGFMTTSLSVDGWTFRIHRHHYGHSRWYRDHYRDPSNRYFFEVDDRTDMMGGWNIGWYSGWCSVLVGMELKAECERRATRRAQRRLEKAEAAKLPFLPADLCRAIGDFL
jgi:hypothetical protein